MRQFRKNIAAAASLAFAVLLSSCEGPTGPEGIAGTAGVPGLSGLQTVSTESIVESSGFATLRTQCPGDKKVISGGYAAVGDGSQFVGAWQSFPIAPNAWAVAVHNSYVGPLRVTAFAICANVS